MTVSVFHGSVVLTALLSESGSVTNCLRTFRLPAFRSSAPSRRQQNDTDEGIRVANAKMEAYLGVLCGGCAQYLPVTPRRRGGRDALRDLSSVTVKCHACGYDKTYFKAELIERPIPRSLSSA